MTANKNDMEARAAIGAAYDDTPKSVFALVAYHLAELAGGGELSAMERLAHEIQALARNGIISEAQARRALKQMPAPSDDVEPAES